MKGNEKRQTELQDPTRSAFYVVSQLVIKVHRQETLVGQYRRGKREKALVIADSPFRPTIGRDLDIPVFPRRDFIHASATLAITQSYSYQGLYGESD